MSQSPDNGAEKLRVLVVDDEPTLRLGFAYALSNRTTTVETAATGRLALERFAIATFDIMILDLRMPELDGIGVIGALRGQGNKIPIILCSAALHPGAALRAIRHDVVDFLLKPVRPVDLRQVIEFVIRPQKQALPLAMQAARNGKTAEAIRLLRNQLHPCPQSLGWLSVLSSILDSEAEENVVSQGTGDAELEEKIHSNLSLLAFNASITQ